MLAGVITDLPLRTRVELAVLRVPALRYLVLQVIGQPVLVGAELLQAHRSAIAVSFAGAIVLAVVVLMAVVAWLLFPRLTREE
jgi:predicted lysophospholipase L1 biosynthesis ABC-type transport system permease subunit